MQPEQSAHRLTGTKPFFCETYCEVVMKKLRNRFKLIYGFGINDANYFTQPFVDGKKTMCPYYKRWHSMMKRCYSEKTQKERPTYIGCTVCDEWLTFSNFKSWMAQQDWKGNQMDKDLKVKGNKVYSPCSCLFVSKQVNMFLILGNNKNKNPKLKDFVGVSFCGKKKKYIARCNDPLKRSNEYIGTYETPEQAHLAWKTRKQEYALKLADFQTNPIVADSLRNYFV